MDAEQHQFASESLNVFSGFHLLHGLPLELQRVPAATLILAICRLRS
jgi:hypothetical protein